ncbi:uncharacterized protein METZ01_LOCUS347709 [marine metagenome]|uniref:Uncharacterized protein n=1 Tax=marine metagenome TaxID=408172 RepID=A0A382RCC6_9ZZZZ
MPECSVLRSLLMVEVAERLFICVASPHMLAKEVPGVCWQDRIQNGMKVSDIATADLRVIQAAIDTSLKNVGPPLPPRSPLAA